MAPASDSPRRAVNMTLSEEVVRDARRFTGNLSETVETLLVAFIADETARRERLDQAIDRSIEMHNEYVDRYGLFGEEYSTLR